MVIRQRLQKHLAGIKEQPPHLLEADRVDLLQSWARLALEVLEELVRRELRLMFPMLNGSDATEDISLFLHTLDEYQRKARLLVRRHFQGQPSAKMHHPANQEWLASLPASAAEVWKRGFTWQRKSPEFGTVTISVEQNPLEVLRMGDYGRSCLGAGSCHQYSAVANAMEANKHVAYARDGTGRILGRQLLAITEENRLVCFYVYPTDVPGELETLFAEYDRAFAHALQLPMQAGENYAVAALLGLQWYDDGRWNVPAMSAVPAVQEAAC